MSHHNLYNSNGLMFWSEEEIRTRSMFVEHMTAAVRNCLMSMNQAFKLVQCEAPILTPRKLINSSYDDKDFFAANYDESHDQDYAKDEHLSFRPETTMGSYAYARHILSGYHDPKFKLPICIWQHGKSFRREQDQPTKFMRLKEFYQLEFQILFSATTAMDYYPHVVDKVETALAMLLPFVKTVPSDRLPSYSDETTDIVYVKNDMEMELCSISRRKDFDANIKNIEVAIGTDRCVHNFMRTKPAD